MALLISQISFNEIVEIWKSNLWKDRQSIIQPISSMVYLGGYDMSIYNNLPTFFAIKKDGKIVAVNSGHMTVNGYYRSRGLWVNEQCRGKGYTYKLFKALVEVAKTEEARYVWSLPRANSVGAYIKNGFSIASKVTDNFELGPHYYVIKDLNISV